MNILVALWGNGRPFKILQEMVLLNIFVRNITRVSSFVACDVSSTLTTYLRLLLEPLLGSNSYIFKVTLSCCNKVTSYLVA